MEKKTFVANIDGQIVKLIDASNGSLKQTTLFPGVKSAEVKGRWVFVSCDDNKTHVYDIDTEEPAIVIILSIIAFLVIPRTPHTNYVGCISVSVMHQNLLWCLMGDEFHVSWHGYGG